MRITRLWVASVVFVLLVMGAATAQSSRIDFSAGGGFSEPEGRAGNNLNTGWNVDFRGGFKPSPHLALDLDWNYNHFNLNNAALARYGEPGGYMNVWSLSFVPILKGSPHWHVTPYVLGGPGLYYRNLSLTQPALVNTFYCDPFFGFCYPATIGVNQVVASNTTYKMGFNGGGGVEVPLRSSNFKIFGEARYSRMFTTHGTDLTFIPVTFGIRW